MARILKFKCNSSVKSSKVVAIIIPNMFFKSYSKKSNNFETTGTLTSLIWRPILPKPCDLLPSKLKRHNIALTFIAVPNFNFQAMMVLEDIEGEKKERKRKKCQHGIGN